MAELKRKEHELSTADLARTPEKPHLVKDGPANVEAPPDSRRPVQSADPSVAEGRTMENRVAENRAENQRVIRKDEARENRRDIEHAREPQRVIDNQRGTPAAARIETSPLFSDAETGDFRSRWGDVQTAFVDEPREAVKRADELVASLMKKLAEGFANERGKLEHAWDRGENVSTEDLRIVLQRYRSFFDRLLKV